MDFQPTTRRLGVAGKLYCVAALSALAVGVLALASMHFARITVTAATHLYEDGFIGVEGSSRLESLIEQHRRIVESAPAEVDRTRLQASQNLLHQTNEKIRALIKELLVANDDGPLDELETQISDQLPQLFERGHSVLFYAYNFAQDKALELAARYALIADVIQAEISAYRQQRLRIADTEVKNLFDSSRSLILWVLLSTFAAFVLIGPFGLLITHGVISRLSGITRAMIRLARHETAVDVPSSTDRDEVGDMARTVAVFKANAIELLRREAELERVNLQLDVALNNMAQGLCMFDSEQRLTICNERYAQMYGLPPELAKPGTSLTEILQHRIAVGNFTLAISGRDASEAASAIASTTGTTSFSQELRDGRVIAVSHQTRSTGGWVAVHEDVTERRRTEAQIAYLARHDVLTDLPNRMLFREHLELALLRVQRGENFGVLCLDLDHFKGVNDTLGHPIGDVLLKAVADRLRNCVVEGDTVARLGGDEFAIIRVDVERPEDVNVLAVKLVEALSAPYELEGNQIIVSTSVGIALAPDDGTSPDQLLKNADMAMYRAKADGRGTHRFFEPEMDARLQARRALEIDLRRAIVEGEFELHYQPLINIKNEEITGFEALIRWNHNTRGVVPPGEFIPLAEETGLIAPLGEWVLRTACAEASTWPSHVKVAVNLSAMQFKNRKLVEVIMNAVAAAELSPHRLELEITESVLLQDDDATLAMLHQMRGLGVRISMDDFGTGYSSLSYLRKFPFDKIKIDQSFIRDLSKGDDSIAIVRAVASLAASLNIATVAEGVETADQLDIARTEGCTEVQGYFFSRPVPAAKARELLTQTVARLGYAA
jgi:diguanylate cyclase (GGDEF)-like protein